MKTRLLQRSFASGEISPQMFSRVDDVRYQSGAGRLQNVITKPTGSAQRRPGFKYVAEVDADERGRLVEFKYSTDQTAMLVFSAGTLQFASNGAMLMAPTTPYVTSKTFVEAAIDPTASIESITINNHGLATGDPVRITQDGTGGTMPSPLVEFVIYYVIRVSSSVFALADTLALAQAGTRKNLLTTGNTNTGANAFRISYAYALGDVVEGTPAGAAGVFYCLQEPTPADGAQETPGNPAYWFQMPGGVYTIPQPYSESELRDLTFASSFDVVTIAHRSHAPYLLRRYGATRWTLTADTLAPAIAKPISTGFSRYPGAYFQATVPAASKVFTTAGSVEHNLARGDYLICEGVLSNGGSWGGSNPAGIYQVTVSGTTTFELADLTGASVTNGGGVTGNGYFRLSSIEAQTTEYYVVTAVNSSGIESVQSDLITIECNLFAPGAFNTITWAAGDTNAVKFRVYRRVSGIFGFIGEALGFSFKDDRLPAQLDRTPPFADLTLSTEHPGVVGYFQQRKILAGPTNYPQSCWMTEVGTESGLNYTIPPQDTNRIAFGLATLESVRIRHVVALSKLLLMTSAAEFVVTPQNSDSLTPRSVDARAHTYVGCGTARPLIAAGNALFVAARGGHVHELGYSGEADGYQAPDLSMRALHLFDGHDLLESALQKAPHTVGWWVSDDGRLLTLTYAPGEKVAGWHWQNTDGTFESVGAIPEGLEDRVYALTRRTINGVQRRFLERMDPLAETDIEDAFFVDCGATYDGAATRTPGGFLHLAGETVPVLADGVVVADRVVSAAGTITLTTPAEVVHAGLRFRSEIITVPPSMQADALGTGRPKNVSSVWVRVQASAGFQIGPSDAGDAGMVRYTKTALVTGVQHVQPKGTWSDDAQIIIRQDDPLPLMVVGLTIEVTLGG